MILHPYLKRELAQLADDYVALSDEARSNALGISDMYSMDFHSGSAASVGAAEPRILGAAPVSAREREEEWSEAPGVRETMRRSWDRDPVGDWFIRIRGA